MKRIVLVVFIVASMGLLVSPVWAETLQGALKNGAVNGELKYMYVDANDTDVKLAKGIDDKTSHASSIHLNYLSGDFYGFTAGVSFEGSHDFTSNSDTPEPRLGFSDTLLSQIYLDYKFDKTDVKVGRQYIATPLIKNTRGWAMYDSFDGVVVTSKYFADTVLMAMYIKDWNTSWSNIEDVHFEDPVMSFYASNKSIKGLKLMGQFMTTDNEGNNGDIPAKTIDGYETYFAQGDYKLPVKFPVTVSLQAGGASFDRDAEDDSNFYGLKLATKVSGIKLAVAYTSVAEDNDFAGTLGHVCNPMFNHMLINSSLFAGLETLSLSAGYDFSKIGIKGLNVRMMMASFSQSDDGMDNSVRNMDGAQEIDLDVKYAFSGALKGLSARIWAGYADHDLDVDNINSGENEIEYVRFFVNYKF